MNEVTKKIAELKETILALEAFNRGEPTQWFKESEQKWVDDEYPLNSILSGVRVRVKPKPREWWDIVSPNGQISRRYKTEQVARQHIDGCSGLSIVHVREVIEE